MSTTASTTSIPKLNVGTSTQHVTSKAKTKVSLKTKIVAASISGIAELSVFHPVDTVAKRLMTNDNNKLAMSEVIFKGQKDTSVLQKWGSLYPGLGYAAFYKVFQRTYKYTMQPVLSDFLSSKTDFDNKVILQATAGAMVGAGEVFLLPLDVLKIRSQTNPDSLKHSLWNIIKTENISLYKGTSWTIARNVPGSFALFGANALAKKTMGIEASMTGEATVLQNSIASLFAATASISISQPMDVIKTRIQKNDGTGRTGAQIVSDLVRKEGFSAFFKGVTPKIVAVGPKLVFSMTVAQTLMRYLSTLNGGN